MNICSFKKLLWPLIVVVYWTALYLLCYSPPPTLFILSSSILISQVTSVHLQLFFHQALAVVISFVFMSIIHHPY